MAVLLICVLFFNDQALEGKCGPHPDTNPQVKTSSVHFSPAHRHSPTLPAGPGRHHYSASLRRNKLMDYHLSLSNGSNLMEGEENSPSHLG